MNNLKLKIEDHESFSKRILNDVPKILSHLFSIILFITTLIFVNEKLVPVMIEDIHLKDALEQQEQELFELKEKLIQVKLAGPFSRKWLPKQYLQFADLCLTDTSVYKKVAGLKKTHRVVVRQFELEKDSKNPAGFNFSIELSGTYSEILEFLTTVEEQFSFLNIKSMDLLPEPAEKRYMGLLRFKLQGWLW